MFVPRKRRNAWQFLKCRPAEIYHDEAVDFEFDENKIKGVILKSGKIVKTDLVIVAAGGLETPLLVAKLSKLGGGDFCKTFTYEDHISVFLARVKLKQSLRSSCRLGSGWSARRAMIGGNSNNPVAFYFRPTLNLAWSKFPPKTVLNQLRNGPNRVLAILKLIFHPSELIEALISKFGISMKSRTFEIFAVASHPHSKGSVTNINLKEAQISINLPTDFEEYLKDSFSKVVSERLSIEKITWYPKIRERWDTGAHHSATFPYGLNNKLLTKDLRHRNLKNVFVCSGAVIPESSYSNTGLTIIALALKLSDYLTNKI